MITRSRLKEIQTLARSKLVEHGRMKLPVAPKDFARKLEILVQPFKPEQTDVSGYLMQQGNGFGIGYSTAIQSEGFQNFTVAHELGHYFIDGHPLAVLQNGKHLSRSGYISKEWFEEEADAFATELLMPWMLIDPLIRAGAGGFGTIKAISGICESSLVASAVRYTQVTKECVAAIVSHLSVVEFMTASDSFKQLRGIDWLRKRDALPPGVLSAPLGTDLQWIQGCAIAEDRGRLSNWFPGVRDRDVDEAAVGLGSYERLLTVLMTEEEDQDDGGDEPDEEDDYIDRWNRGIFRGKHG